jgi:hypothetical protein
MREGATLRALIDAEAPMRPARAVELALQIVTALEPLHREGRAHGDVRAEHVVFHNGRVALLPTPTVDGLHDRQGDIRATATLLYEMLTRSAPDAATPVSRRTPAMLPARLDVVVTRAMGDAAFDSLVPFAQELRVCLLDALGAARKQRF